MFYVPRTFRLVPPDNGVMESIRPIDIGVRGFVSAKNVVYKDGRLVCRPGLVKGIQPVPSSPSAMGDPIGLYQFYDSTGASIIVAVTTQKFYKYNGERYPDAEWIEIPVISGSSQITMNATIANRVSFVTWDFGTPDGIGILFCNNSEKIIKWTPSMPHALEISQAPVCSTLCVSANRIVAGGIRSGSTSNDRAVTFSDPLNVHSGWTEVVVLSDTPGPIIALKPMGNLAFAVFKSDAIYLAQAARTGVGGIPFAFSLRVSGIDGPVGQDAIAPSGVGGYYYLGKSGTVYFFDGVTVKSMGENIRKYIAERIDPVWGINSVMLYDFRKNWLIILFPEQGMKTPSSGVIINPDNGSLWPISYGVKKFYVSGIVDFPKSILISEMTLPMIEYSRTTFASLTTRMPSTLHCTDQLQTFIEGGTSDDGTPIEFSFITGVTDMLGSLPALESSVYSAMGSKLITFCEHHFNMVQTPGDEIYFIIRSGRAPGMLRESLRTRATNLASNTTHCKINDVFFSFGYSGQSSEGFEWHFTNIGVGGFMRK